MPNVGGDNPLLKESKYMSVNTLISEDDVQ